VPDGLANLGLDLPVFHGACISPCRPGLGSRLCVGGLLRGCALPENGSTQSSNGGLEVVDVPAEFVDLLLKLLLFGDDGLGVHGCLGAS
jgi:hypothetical protein